MKIWLKIMIISIVFLTSAAPFAQAQFDWNAILNFMAYPSPYIGEWEYDPSIANLTIYNNSGEEETVIVYLTVSRQGGGLIGTINSQPLIISPSPPPMQFNSDEFIDWESADYDKSIETIIIRTGRLPEGDYVGCIRIEDTRGSILLDNVCAYFSIVYPAPPSLLMPMHEDTLVIPSPAFQWTPSIHPPQYQIHYSLKIAEILHGQTPARALLSNIPHYENQDIMLTMHQYPINGLPFEPAKDYAWQVQALDQYGYPCFANDGKSEIFTFAYGDTLPSEPEEPSIRFVSGFLRDLMTNRPVDNARIVYHDIDESFEGDTLVYIESSKSKQTKTNREGYFEIPGVRDSSYFSLRAEKEGYIPSLEYSTMQYWAGDVYEFGLIITADSADIGGRIEQVHYGAPIPELLFELWQNVAFGAESDPGDDRIPRLITSARTDTDGNFTIENIPGGDGYFIKTGGKIYHEYTSDEFSVVGGPPNDLGTFYLTPKFGKIGGDIKDEEGNLIVGARVYLYPDSGFTFVKDPTEPGAPERPESQSLFGPDTTDFSGHYNFEQVILNDPEQVMDRYVVWVEANGYYNDYLPARITEFEQELILDFELRPVLGMIYGTVTSSIDGSPVGDTRVELLAFNPEGESEGGQTNIIAMTAYANPDGSYSLPDIEAGIYRSLRFTKVGFEDLVIELPGEITNGMRIQQDAILQRPTGVVAGTVVDDEGMALFGAYVQSPDAPHISEYTSADGSFLITNAPGGELSLEFSLPGFSDAVETLDVSVEDTNYVEVTMAGYRGSITIIVEDSLTNNPIPQATVMLQGEEEATTDNTGSAIFDRVPVGSKTLRIVPPSGESDTLDYRERSTNIDIADGPNPSLTIKLVRAGRISGTVVLAGTGSPISGVRVEIDGVPGITDTTDSAGRYVLRNVPAGENLTISAGKIGYQSAYVDDIIITEGQHLQNVDIELEESPIFAIYGFPMEVFLIENLPNGNKKIAGAIVDVPSNPALELSDPGFRFYFDSLIVDPNYQPVSDELSLIVSEAPVKLFGQLDATMKDTTGAMLKARWLDSLMTGEIRGDIVLDNDIPLWIPGSDWSDEKIPRDEAPAFWSLVEFPELAGSAFGMAATQNTVSATFWGFSISVDYAQTRLDSSGLHYYGALGFEQLQVEIGIEDLNIRKNLDTDRLEFVGVTVSTDPPVQIPMGLFTVVDSSATWNEAGFRTDGAIIVTSLEREFGFNNLRISPDGDFLSLIFTADAESGAISVLTAEFTILEIGFGTDEASQEKFFQFSGALSLPRLGEPVEFQNLRFTESGVFTGVIQFNQEKTIAGIVTLQLQAIEFNEDDRGRFIFVMGGIAFDIPNLHVQVGNLRFYEDGSFNIEQIEISFTAGPAQVAVSVEWADDVFSGSGSLAVQPAFSASAEFRYGGLDDWWIKLTANANIPIGYITIVSVSGEIGYQEGTWIFGIGGGFTAGRLEKALVLDLYVRVLATPDGPIINGSAEVIAMSGLEIGTATVCLDFAHDRFTGNIMFGFEKSGVEVTAQIDIDIQVNEYWFVGAAVTIDFFSLASLNADLAVANNYTDWMHSLPVAYHPDNQPINGFHVDVVFHQGIDGWCWSLSVDTWAYLLFDWNGDMAAGMKFTIDAWVDLWIVGGSAYVNLEAAMQSVNDCLSVTAGADVQLKLWIGCCGRGSGCWRPCWAWIFPCGFTACFNLSVDVDYNCNSGWDYALDW
ncbi:MAG: carboxypeptidase regulatory-like domain-containing protein [candidate division Zixibacteria bacterium]|nr:carboxypeptidase regulatory-like domain-containing protein [candidate division Zixibacteria bacterium]